MIIRILAIALILTCSGLTLSAQTAPSTAKKYHDNIDDRMKGPNGEKIYIGEAGGRYYLKNGKKVYVKYNGKKKKS
jgi:hypothetical protein